MSSFDPFKAITRAVGIPDKIVPWIFPVPWATSKLTDLAISATSHLISGALTPRAPAQQMSVAPQIGYGPTPPYNVSYGAPSYSGGYGAGSYGGGYGGGAYDAWNYQPLPTPYGGSPWGYSTQSPMYLSQPFPTYSAPVQDRTWEDLIPALLPAFL
jgi:hypothetical protein